MLLRESLPFLRFKVSGYGLLCIQRAFSMLLIALEKALATWT